MGGGGKARKGGAVVNGRSGRFVGTDRLTEQQARFVAEIVANGGNGTQAAAAAGYAAPGQAAYQLKNLPHVLAAIHEERNRLIGGELANKALSVLRDIMADSDAPAAVRRLAARDALEMAGHLGPNSRASAPDEDKPLAEMTPDELQRFIDRETAALAELRKAVPVQIEGEASPIPPGLTPGSSVTDLEPEAYSGFRDEGAPPTEGGALPE